MHNFFRIFSVIFRSLGWIIYPRSQFAVLERNSQVPFWLSTPHPTFRTNSRRCIKTMAHTPLSVLEAKKLLCLSIDFQYLFTHPHSFYVVLFLKQPLPWEFHFSSRYKIVLLQEPSQILFFVTLKTHGKILTHWVSWTQMLHKNFHNKLWLDVYWCVSHVTYVTSFSSGSEAGKSLF